MADPITGTMAAVSIGSSIAGAVTGAAGAEEQGSAKQAMYNYQAGVAQINQQIAEKNAQTAISVGESKAQISGMGTAQRIGQIKAGQGASGLDVNSGSAVAVRQGQQDVGTFEEGTIRSNAARESYGYQVEGWQQGQQANLDVMAGQQAKTAGDIGATSSIIGGVSSLSSKWLSFKNAGLIS